MPGAWADLEPVAAPRNQVVEAKFTARVAVEVAGRGFVAISSVAVTELAAAVVVAGITSGDFAGAVGSVVVAGRGARFFRCGVAAVNQ